MKPVYLEVHQANRFFKIDGPKGYQRTCFFPRLALPAYFNTSDPTTVTGYVSFRYLTVNNTPQGVVFESNRAKTEVKPYIMRIGIDGDKIPDNFEPMFSLEKMGLLMFRTVDSGVLIVPCDVDSSLLVRA